eukprot:CAMPEP_0184297774 /NCGR_PEP_ID=MMETSP1049-20130417/8649_1 /TAXON_ID=77928 /ORGANISM="Proteomonas sulcata, Strain CCMP704" /LENGTH=141 /DNA_ID=CAMNT_0026607655 /DNA_START=3 /DNA_END=428 /DNA_ORIENTATION=+
MVQSAVRVQQVKDLCNFIKSSATETSSPPVVCGTFNATADSDEIRMLTGKTVPPVKDLVFFDAWEAKGEGAGATFSSENPFAEVAMLPERRIDYIFTGWPTVGGRGQVLSTQVFGQDIVMSGPSEGMVASDHFGVVATLRY